MRKFVIRGLISIMAMLTVLGTFNGGLLRSDKAFAAAPFPGSGTAVSPYLVGTADLFNSIRSYRTSKYYFKLTSDIDLSGYAAATGWDPIGNISGPFYAHIDGDGYKITGLKINNPTGDYMGLFGYLGSGYSITNLTLDQVSITGNQYVGGLAGYMVAGTIGNVSVSGNVTGKVDVGGLVGSNYGGTINGSHASATVNGTTDVGGLVGDFWMNGSSINNSYASGDVSGGNSSENVGGLVGVAGTATVISNSYTSGRVSGGSKVGGLVGSLVAVTLSNSYASGDVSGNSFVGGLVGTSATTALITDSYASGAVRGTSSVGGFLGHKNYNLTIKNSYASGLVNEGIGSMNVGGFVGETDSGGAPIINSFYDINGTGQSISAGGSGISTGLMQNRSTFEADTANKWDFSTKWAIESIRNGGYPYLLTTQAYLDYDGNGGINGTVPSSRSYVPGEKVGVHAGTFVLNQALIDAGCIFYGWNTKANGSGVTYKPGDSITLTSNTTLYASWMIPSGNAGLTTTIGTVSSNGSAEESVTNVPYGTTLTALKAAITPAADATYEIYDADGTTVATLLKSGTKIIVTAQDRITKVTYTVTVNANSAKDITSYSLAAQTGAATINATARTVSIQVAYGTDRSSLAATFALSTDATANVGGVDQISGTTVNDFRNPVTYVVKAGDGSTQSWTVTVTVALNSAKDITAFSLAAQTGPATINTTSRTVSIKVAYGTSLNGLVASFTLSAGATAKVGSTIQTSGTTSNNFTSAVTYTVTAENGTSQTWKVTVTVAAASSAKDITAFSLAEQTNAATINATAHTVSIEVTNGTQANGLVATFTLSAGATVKVGGYDQVSGTTANDFTNAVLYTVKAENGTTQDWTVTLSVAKSSVATLTSTIGTVSAGGTASETITNIPYGTTLAALKAAITLAANATYEVYEADGTTVASILASGYKIIVTAQDGTTQVTYTVTVNGPLSSAATLTSTIGTVSAGGTASETITNIPYGTTLAVLKAAITLAANATYEVYEADGTTVASILASSYKIIVTAQDGTTQVTYTVTVNGPLSSVATLTSTIGTVSAGGTASETITNIPYGTTLAALKAAITVAANATYEVYEADGTTVASILASGYKIIVTAQDGTTQVTYTVTVNGPLSSVATLTSTIGTVSAGGTTSETITNIPYGTTLAALKAAITQAANATYEVYEANGTTVASLLASGYKIIVTAQDGTTTVTYTVTVNGPLSSVATLTSTIGTVSAGGTTSETIKNIPYGTTLAALKAAITLAANATYEVYEANGTTVASILASGYKIIVTAQDGTTTVTYTVTVNTLPPGGGSTTPTSPTNTIVSSTDGKLTLPSGREGVVSLDNEVIVSVPADATDKEIKIIIDKLTDSRELLTNNEVLVTAIYEILKNFPENFLKPVTLTFTFDPARLKSNQTVAVFYFDEAKKIWVEVKGGKINKNQITVTVNHFTKFAVFTVGGQEPPANPEPKVTLSDIAGHWAEAAIKQAIAGGIVTGYPDGTFKPNRTVTRAEFTVMLMNALKLHGAEATLTFTDSKKVGAWAKSAVAQAVQAGYIKGYQDGTFRPDAAITRAEMAAMVAKALGLSVQEGSLTGFADDKNIPAWAKSAVATMKELGLITGKGGNKFAPAAETTRAEAITVLLNMLIYKNK
ncbi:hypothetical protein D7Z26_07255 [Cohnella endophytica]|uniref:SLH domain-containing protein n=1 Tax=Cohnella endophytica TaxID=2419778 RepID=A0A494Y523_9BACL|nr:S-layer homology domain-containing protein [Cohnella endophytica]RKP55020.1 hypothetical protein D7Z26_07255 [Cohnella endophytica]